MRNTRTRLTRWLPTLLLLAACGPEPVEPTDPEQPTQPEPPKPTYHTGPITQSETWRAANNPHVVSLGVMVGGSAVPTLTLEAGTVVRFEAGATLFVGVGKDAGALRSEGTAAAPVLLTANADAPKPGHWKGVFVSGNAQVGSHLAHTTIEYAGNALADDEDALIPAAGLNLMGALGDDAPTGRPAVLDHVTIQKSQAHGLVMLGMSLGTGSSALTLRDNGKSPLVVSPNELGSLPADITLSGNAVSTVQLMSGLVRDSQTWPNLGVPYLLSSPLKSVAPLISVGATSKPTLTLSAGTEFQMPTDAAFFVGGGSDESGTLIAMGTAQAPIRFVADATTAAPGHWSGLAFSANTGSKLDHVLVSHAGSPLFGSLGGGGLNLLGDPGPTITHTTLRHSSGCGIATLLESQTDYTQATLGNTFADNADKAQCVK